MELNEEDKKYLLEIARNSIGYYLRNGTTMNVDPGSIPNESLIEDGASFVTLHKKTGELRGCIGMLEARRPLVLDVASNAVAAAVQDPRFPPTKLEELNNLKISISVLTEPEELEVKDWKDLLGKLIPKKHGLIIKKGFSRATFLPVVWEELPDKEEFLGELCMKAGFNKEEWKKPGMRFLTYEAIEFKED